MDSTTLQSLGKQVSDLQNALSSFEEKLMANERSTFLKTSVEHYREQTQKVRDLYLSAIAKELSLDLPSKSAQVEVKAKPCCKAPESELVANPQTQAPSFEFSGVESDEENPFGELEEMHA